MTQAKAKYSTKINDITTSQNELDLYSAIGPDKDAPTNEYTNGDVYVGYFLGNMRHGKNNSHVTYSF